MSKKILSFLINVGIMFIVLDFFPGFKAPYQAVSKLYAGIIFALMILITKSIRTMFGFPKLAPIYFTIGTVLTFVVFWIVSTFIPNVFSFAENYVGGGNFIFFSIPKILVLQDSALVILFAAIIANFCSIIMSRLKH
jgi:hypothetical protein